MARIDIVVFPNGGREVFGQVKLDPPASAAVLATEVAHFATGLPAADKPRKFTGYYDKSNVSDIEWQPYDENNPIVMVPMEPMEPEETAPDVEATYKPMELAQVPAAFRGQLDISGQVI